MRAIAKVKPERGLWLIDAPKPSPSEEDVLIQIKVASICGTDLHIYKWDQWAEDRIKTPLIIGHECAGEVVAVGPKVTRVAVGDHVSVESHVPCGDCLQCQTDQMHLCHNVKIVGIDRPGGFADYLVLPEICCVKQERSMPWEIAALQEPLGNAVYCVSESEVRGKSVAIFGDGPIGIFAVAVARALEADKIIACGLQPFRLELIKRFHPDVIIDVQSEHPRERILHLTGGVGVDVVLEMSGNPRAIHDGLAVARSGGAFTFFGVPSNPVEIDIAKEIIFKGLTLKSIFGRRMFETWEEMAKLQASGKLDVSSVITHEFPFEKIDEAMGLLTQKEVKAGKITLRP